MQDRRVHQVVNEWSIPSGGCGVTGIVNDPFHENCFSCIHENTSLLVKILTSSSITKQMFDRRSSRPISTKTSAGTASFNGIFYNPHKASIMAVGCSDHTIQLFNTANHSFADLYSTLYHPCAITEDYENKGVSEQATELPKCIETEFDVKHITWNARNPSISSIESFTSRLDRGMWLW